MVSIVALYWLRMEHHRLACVISTSSVPPDEQYSSTGLKRLLWSRSQDRLPGEHVMQRMRTAAILRFVTAKSMVRQDARRKLFVIANGIQTSFWE